MLVERSFAWWAKRAEEDDALPCTAGRPEASVSTIALATAMGGPGPRLKDTLNRDELMRRFMERAVTSDVVANITRSYRVAEYEAVQRHRLDPEYLAALRAWSERVFRGPGDPYGMEG